MSKPSSQELKIMKMLFRIDSGYALEIAELVQIKANSIGNVLRRLIRKRFIHSFGVVPGTYSGRRRPRYALTLKGQEYLYALPKV